MKYLHNSKTTLKVLIYVGSILLAPPVWAENNTQKQLALKEIITQANKHFSAGEYDKALAAYRKILSLKKAENADKNDVGTLKIAIARTLQKLGKHQSALVLLNENIASFSDDKQAIVFLETLFQKSKLLAVISDYEALEALYQKVQEDYLQKVPTPPFEKSLEAQIKQQNDTLGSLKKIEYFYQRQGNVSKLLTLLEKRARINQSLQHLEEIKIHNKKHPVPSISHYHQMDVQNIERDSLLMEMLYNYVRFLQWQGKHQQAELFVYSFTIDAPAGVKAPQPIKNWASKILNLVANKPAYTQGTKQSTN